MFGFSLYEDFREFIIALNKNAVRYLVVGGYAVVYHGYNRTTGDLDIWVEQTEENYKKLVRAFLDFGFPTNAFSKQDFLDNQNELCLKTSFETNIFIVSYIFLCYRKSHS
jgi:hypothetical protein